MQKGIIIVQNKKSPKDFSIEDFLFIPRALFVYFGSATVASPLVQILLVA